VGDGKDTLLYDRYTSFRTLGVNYNYQTVPQEALNNRVIDYSRGKGLGGTSLINFALWNRGPKDDYDEWARRLGDEMFAWENVKKVFDGIEKFEDPMYEDARRKYVSIDKEAHGQDGPVHVEFQQQWEDFMPNLMKGIEENRWPLNGDLNSGNPIGVGLCPSSSNRGVRVTAKSAYLSRVRENLKIRAGVQIARVVFEGMRAVGVESVEGEKSELLPFNANKIEDADCCSICI
jgi:choline dehydrogenase-like flavoprotein